MEDCGRGHMGCGQCGHENQPGSKFCSECGAPLAVRCRSCDAEQLPGAKFCNQCGSSLTAALPEPPAAPDAARKQVTALFADLVGSTAFGEQLDPEATRTALAPYFELLRTTIEDHAGTVAKFMGDGMMALFGVPEVAEDDALRAVIAGAELQLRFRNFAERVREQHGVELGLRVGINSGELVVADGDADLVGDVLNTASRLESSCSPGRVLVGEDTWRLTRSAIAYEVQGEVRVKGKAEPVAAFEVSDSGASTIEENIPFVGRVDELEQLLAAFEVARDSPIANLVTIVGAPGVGKTRLAYELRAATDARSFDLRFERRGSTTFSPIAELLREVTDGSAEGVERLLTGHAEHARLVPVVQSFLGIGEARSTEESFWAVRRLLEHLTVLHGPVIVVVDDIQWAEPLFWDLLDHLVEWAEAPVLIVALARPELRELRPELTQTGRRVAAAISLEGLDDTATRELAVRLLDTDELPDELIERIPDTTEGNPLFVRELVQMLVDDGTLALDGDRWRLTIDADAIEVPPTILSLLASRVERLPDDERQVIEFGSVIGTEFDRGTLTAITPPDISSRLGALVDRLRRKDLIEPSGAWAGDHPVYRFHHVLVRDAAYRRLLKGRRADLHELVGRHIGEAGVGDDVDVTVAHHFEQAYSFRSELGAVDEATRALASAAVERLARAADLALAREDLPSAGGYAQRALALVDEQSTERDELLLLGCEALLASGDVTAATPLVGELHERSTDERLTAWANCFRAQRWSLTDPDRLTEAADAADAAAIRLGELDDQAGVAKGRLVRAGCLARLGRVGECEAELDLALGAARAAGDRRRTVAVLGAAPLAALWGPSPVARAGGRCLDVLRLLRITTAAPAVEATSVRCQGVLEALRGRFDSARDKLDQSRTTARDLGLRQGLFETELFAGFVEMWAGDPVAAEPHLREAHEGLGRLGIGADAGQAGALLARSLLAQGRVDAADALAKEAVDTAGQNLQTAMASRAVLAEIRAVQGRHDEAHALIDQAIEIAERTDVVLDHAMVLMAAERVAGFAGDQVARRRHAEAARRLLADKGAADAIAEPVTAPESAETAPTGDTAAEPMANHELRNLATITWTEHLPRDRGRDAEDPDEYFERWLHDDLVFDVHRRVVAAVGGGKRELVATSASWRGAGFGAFWSVLAIRGDHLGLFRLKFAMDEHDGDTDDHVLVYVVVEVDDDGMTRHFSAWDDVDLVEAQLELDTRWADEIGLAADHPARTLRTTLYTTDPAELMSIAQPDIEYVEHRRVSFEGGGAAALAMATSTMDLVDHVVVPVIHGISHTACMFEKHDVSATGEITAMLLVLRFVDGLVGSYDIYDVDDLDRALARYHELSAATTRAHQPLANLATQIFDDAHIRAMREGNEEYLAGLIDDGLVYETHRGTAGGGGGGKRELVDAVMSWRNLSMVPVYDVLAVRGDHLALVRATLSGGQEPDRIVFLGVVEVTDERRIIHWTSWAEDDLTAAQVELSHRHHDRLGFAPDHPMRALAETAFDTSPDAWSGVIAPEFEFVEHRKLSFASGGHDEMLHAATSMRFIEHVEVPRVLAISDEAVLLERHEIDAEGERSMLLAVTVLRDGAPVRMEVFDLDDLDAALARYDELDRGGPDALANRATRTWFRVPGIDEPGLLEGIERWFRDDLVFDVHRKVVAAPGGGKRELIATATSWRDSGIAFSRSVIAIRGDDLALFEMRFGSGSAADDDDHVVVYGVIEVDDDGMISYFGGWDDVDLTAAQIALDRRYFDGLGLPDDHPCRRYDALAYSTDPQALIDVAPGDLQYVEHRTVSFASGGVAEFADVSSTMDLIDHVTVPVIHRISADAVAYTTDAYGANGECTSSVLVIGYDDGAISTVDTYDVDDLDRALARFDELAGGPSDTDPRNRATIAWLERMQPLVHSGDLDGLAGWLRDDLVFEVNRTVVSAPAGGKEEFLAALRSWLDVGVTPVGTPIAVRGDHLALTAVRLAGDSGDTGDAEVVTVILVEVDDDGRVSHLVGWDDDDLTAAQRELDRLWFDRVGLPADAAARTEVAYTTDPAALMGFAHPELQYRQHRRLSFEGGGSAEFERRASVMPMVDHVVIPRIHRASERASLFEKHEIDAEGERSMFLVVVGFRDGLAGSFDVYDLEDLTVAIARYDEIVGGDTPQRSVALGLMERFGAAVQAGDAAAARAVFDDGFVRRAHYRFHTGGDLDADRFVESQIEQWHRADEASIDLGLLAERGSALALVRADFTMDGAEMPMRVVSEVRDGRFIQFDIYDADQDAEARAEFDRRSLERSAQVGNAAWAVATEVYQALSEGDTDRVDALLADDYSAVPATPLQVKDDGRLSRDEILAIAPGRLFPKGTGRVIQTREEHLALGCFEPDDPGSFPAVYSVVRLGDDGRLAESIRFGPDQREAADEALDHMWARHGGPTEVLDARQRLRQAWRERSRSAVRALFHDDFTSVDHRELAFGERNADEFVASLDIESGYGVDAGWHVGVQPLRHTDSVLLEHWTMTINDDTFVWEVCQVLRVSNGKFVTWDNFPIEQLALAEARFEELAGGSGGRRPIDRVYAAFGTHWNAGDLERLRALHHDDLEILSHRRVVTPGHTRGDEAWRSLAAMAEVFPTFEFTTIGSPTDQVSLARITVANEDEIELALLGIVEIDGDELITRIATFDPDDERRANALLDEWAHDDHPAGPPALDNDALRLALDVVRRWGSGERIDATEVTESDYTFAGRRRSAPHIDGGVTATQEMLDYWLGAGLVRAEAPPIAVRGELLAITLMSVTTSEGDEMSFLILAELGESDRWRHMSVFDPDQLGEAVDELDRRWLALGGPANLIEGSGRMRRAFAVPGLDAELIPLTSDFFTIDHRLVGLGRRDRDAFIASGDQITPSIAYMTQDFGWIERGETSIASYEIMIERHDDEFVWHALHVARYEGIEMAELHVFAPEQFAEARAMFDQMSAGSSAAGHVDPDHPAVALRNALTEAWNRGDVDAIRALTHPDLEIFSYRSVVTPGHTRGDEARTALLAVHEFFPRLTVELIATRGDDLGLSAFAFISPDDIELNMLSVIQVTPDGLTIRTATFDADDLDRALALLDEWAGG